MKYRSRMEIITQILEIARQETSKTKIMYGAYITYSQLNEYMPFLLENKLLMRKEGTELYRLTEKGYRMLNKCRELDEFTSAKEQTGVARK